jgi:hypothetical protein
MFQSDGPWNYLPVEHICITSVYTAFLDTVFSCTWRRKQSDFEKSYLCNQWRWEKSKYTSVISLITQIGLYAYRSPGSRPDYAALRTMGKSSVFSCDAPYTQYADHRDKLQGIHTSQRSDTVHVQSVNGHDPQPVVSSLRSHSQVLCLRSVLTHSSTVVTVLLWAPPVVILTYPRILPAQCICIFRITGITSL